MPGSVASVSAADLAWALTLDDGDIDMSGGHRFGWSLKQTRDHVGVAFAKAVKQFGGPMQYLQHRYPDTAAKGQYAQRLWAEFPPQETHQPYLAEPLPSCQESDKGSNVPGADLILHLAQLDFSMACTMKGPPGLRTSLQLADEIISSGFISMGDPVCVTPLPQTCNVQRPWPVEDAGEKTMEAFAMGYVKGAARLCTLHVLVTLCLDDNVSFSQARGGGPGIPSAERCLA